MLVLKLLDEPSLQSLEAEKGGNCLEGLFFCMALFLLLDETLALRDGPARLAKTTLVLEG